jgi:hypothetical protein
VLEVQTLWPGPGYTLGDVSGVVGLVLYIGSYLALQLGLIRGDGYLYAVLNLFAALFALLSLLEMFNLYAALAEVAWIVISLIGIARLYIVHRFLSLTPDERAAAAALVPGLPKDRARRLLRTGTWVELPAGEVIATEGEPVGALVYIAEGRCRIIHRGVRVAEIGAGGLIGDDLPERRSGHRDGPRRHAGARPAAGGPAAQGLPEQERGCGRGAGARRRGRPAPQAR